MKVGGRFLEGRGVVRRVLDTGFRGVGGGETFCLGVFKTLATFSGTMYLSISFRKSTPPQERQLCIFICNSKQRVDDSVGELTF